MQRTFFDPQLPMVSFTRFVAAAGLFMRYADYRRSFGVPAYWFALTDGGVGTRGCVSYNEVCW